MKLNTGLTELDLRKNYLHTETVVLVAEMIAENKRLRTLYLCENCFRQETCSIINTALQINKSINYCSYLDNAAPWTRKAPQWVVERRWRKEQAVSPM